MADKVTGNSRKGYPPIFVIHATLAQRDYIIDTA